VRRLGVEGPALGGALPVGATGGGRRIDAWDAGGRGRPEGDGDRRRRQAEELLELLRGGHGTHVQSGQAAGGPLGFAYPEWPAVTLFSGKWRFRSVAFLCPLRSRLAISRSPNPA